MWNEWLYLLLSDVLLPSGRSLHFLLEVGFSALCICRSGCKVGHASPALVLPVPWCRRGWESTASCRRNGRLTSISSHDNWNHEPSQKVDFAVVSLKPYSGYVGILEVCDKFPQGPHYDHRDIVNLPNFLVAYLLLLCYRPRGRMSRIILWCFSRLDTWRDRLKATPVATASFHMFSVVAILSSLPLKLSKHH